METRSRILVAEDESIIAMDLKSILLRMGYDVTAVVNNALEAIQKAEEEKPDIILMDILLAGFLDGIEAAKIISYSQTVPVIYLSAINDDKTMERVNNNPFSMFIRKPFREYDLRKAIEKMLNQKRLGI